MPEAAVKAGDQRQVGDGKPVLGAPLPACKAMGGADQFDSQADSLLREVYRMQVAQLLSTATV
ncbi:hypothetical protein ACGFIG_16995 [Micromonospora sp. NPDC049048]|uniref:hypothetical protein n=1 Tax=Micromonospora sp. NPDC049048 TaxID=3364263 RepID=UPI0037140832